MNDAFTAAASTASKRLALALTAAGVVLERVDVRRGPRLATFDAVLPRVHDVDRVMRMGRSLAGALQVRRVHLAETERGVAVEVELLRGMRRELTVLDVFPERMPGTWVAAGRDGRGQDVRVSLADPSTAHLLVVGATGSGKTTALQSIVWQLVMRNTPADLALVLIDGLASGLAPFADVPHLVLPLAASPRAGADAIRGVCTELDARIADPARRTPLVVVVDELAQLTDGRDAVGAGLSRIAATGRGLGVHLIAATQHPTASVVGRLVSANITTRLVGKVADAAASRLAMGSDRDDARTLMGAGDMLLCRGDDVRRVQCPVVTDAEWAMLPSGGPSGALEFRVPKAGQHGVSAPHPAPIPTPHPDVERVARLWEESGMPGRIGIMSIRRAIGCGDSRARRLRAEAEAMLKAAGIPNRCGDTPTRARAHATTTGARDV